MKSVSVAQSLFQDAATNTDPSKSTKGDEEGNQKHLKTPIGRKIYEFYNTPFTKFWFNTASTLLLILKVAYCL